MDFKSVAKEEIRVGVIFEEDGESVLVRTSSSHGMKGEEVIRRLITGVWVAAEEYGVSEEDVFSAMRDMFELASEEGVVKKEARCQNPNLDPDLK